MEGQGGSHDLTACSMRINKIGKWQTQRKVVEKMVHGSGSTLKKISKKTLTKRPARDRFEDLMGGEFYNGAFKKSLLILHEHPTQKDVFPVITG
jgi:hypothetical protein